MNEQMKSNEYKYLERRIAQIEKNFKFKQSINGITALQADRLRGLRLLCHAEFEDYFESVALRLLNVAESGWLTEKVANYNLASLFIWHEKILKKETYETKARMIIADFRKQINENHGIKEDNIISSLDSFGVLRGETAHTSAKKTQQPLDQNTELTRIKDLLLGIQDFEQIIDSK